MLKHRTGRQKWKKKDVAQSFSCMGRGKSNCGWCALQLLMIKSFNSFCIFLSLFHPQNVVFSSMFRQIKKRTESELKIIHKWTNCVSRIKIIHSQLPTWHCCQTFPCLCLDSRLFGACELQLWATSQNHISHKFNTNYENYVHDNLLDERETLFVCVSAVSLNSLTINII